MEQWFTHLNPVIQALLATCFTWLMTAAGASVVLYFKTFKQKVLDGMLGFAAGVMIAASIWSLLVPAISLAEEMNLFPLVPATTGFLAGAFFIWGINKVLPHMHSGLREEKPEGRKSRLQRSVLLILAITIHNIPEGLAIGVAFGALAEGYASTTLGSAVALAIGIGLQNLPEGASVALPLKREGFSRRKSFFYGQLSGLVEPLAGLAGAAAVVFLRPALPYSLSFAAGAMLFVVIEELIPESHANMNKDYATLGTITGFAVMMCLDVALG